MRIIRRFRGQSAASVSADEAAVLLQPIVGPDRIGELIGQSDEVRGRKVFFLYPHSVIRDELIEELLRNEYEVYVLNHHAAALRAIRAYNDAILFINIDEGMSEHSWERYIRRVMENPETENVRIGVLSYNEDRELARKYLIDMMVPCGFVTLRIGIKESMRIVLKTLEANEAKGRRQFLRTKAPNQAHANVELENRIYPGSV